MHKFFLILILTIFNLPTFADSTNNPFSLSTTSFQNHGALPADYSCDGKNISPALSWSHAPKNTKTFAFILSDPDAPSGVFYHWVLYNIPKSATSLTEGMENLPEGTIVGQNEWHKSQYKGPCPPKGSKHTYIFSLYALDTNLNLPADANAKSLLEAMRTHIIGKPATLTATYSH